MVEGPMTTVEGTAGNGKAGAVVMSSGGGVVYVDGLDAWPKGVDGKAVAATGVLHNEKKIPVADARAGR